MTIPNKYLNEFKAICRLVGPLAELYDLNKILAPYCEDKRHFHTLKHVFDLVFVISSDVFNSDVEKYSFLCAALFHDVVYDPQSKNNENYSAMVFADNYWKDHERFIDYELVTQLILGTSIIEDQCCRIEVRRFNEYDRLVLTRSVPELVEYGNQIWNEYSHLPYSMFLKGHFELIRRIVLSTFRLDPMKEEYLKNISIYENIMKKKRLKVGLYVGSFNPFHLGHLDILLQAEKLFDKVIISSGINPGKMVIKKSEVIPTMEVKIDGVPTRFEQTSFNMLLARYVEKLESEEQYDVTIVRGFRDEKDISSELIQRKYSLELNQNLKYVFLTSSPGMEHISSSGIRTLKQFEEDVSRYLPKPTKGFLES